MKVAHIYATGGAGMNSGDFMLGLAAKWHFRVRMAGEPCTFTDLDCRDAGLYRSGAVQRLNDYDAVLVGPGGLVLPDSQPNKISCWQWAIAKECYGVITVPIHVLAIGWNLFYGQTLDMPDRETNATDASRTPVFRENMRSLVSKAASFTMRHRPDVAKLIEVVGKDMEPLVRFEECPTVPYVRELWQDSAKKAVAIEVKTDREWRRFAPLGTQKVYTELLRAVRELLAQGEEVVHLSHDGSSAFERFCISQGLRIPALRNGGRNEAQVRGNYSQFDIIVSTAGHAQMISHGLGKLALALDTHPKVRAFSEDNGTPLIELTEIGTIPDVVKNHRKKLG
jgi:hypothetical protein